MGDRTRRELESALSAPDVDGRLRALAALCAVAEYRPRRGTNLHVHTNESFSVFNSPTEAVWQAVCEGIAVFGINDHYTVAGHDEFGRACKTARIPATFSMEAVAMDRDAEARGELTNDPGNPGRTYLCAKGVTRIPPENSQAMRDLGKMRAALEQRNKEMTEKMGDLFRRRIDRDGPAWGDVVALTPRGNTTERHIAKAALVRLRALADPDGRDLAELVSDCCGASAPDDGEAALQNVIRAKLLKAGGPCYVQESPDAFLSVEDMRDLFLAFGAVPTYPVLANPVTERERDIPALMDRLEAMQIFALEVIPGRNTKERLAEVVAAAKKRWWPVFNGTEHNTPDEKPLLAPLSLDPEFLPWFEQSAALLLGHQWFVRQGDLGFVLEDGSPYMPSAQERFEQFRDAGRQVWEQMERSAGGYQ
jgi:hypothetical protein